ncbi:hypothetical protein BKA66DRAFT_587891 [Pyrenochaeta sp. MPI-SDFR-AT-0127]|nr:hypothetical protein BKA66DRAFT_587891 [Pyrenochaeta sp. MPI-SDFR-AT-0127]
MKLIQLAALFGGAAAAQSLVAQRLDNRALSDVTTTVVLATSTFTVTKCATDATNCPAGATVVQTSTTVISVTTTICSLTSTPGIPPPPFQFSSTPVATSAAPTGVASVTVSIIPPPPTSVVSVPVVSASSLWVSVSIISGSPFSLPVATDTLSDGIPASFPPGATASSIASAPPQSSAFPTFSLPATDANSISSSYVPVSSFHVTASASSSSISSATDAIAASSSVSSSKAAVKSSVNPSAPSDTHTTLASASTASSHTPASTVPGVVRSSSLLSGPNSTAAPTRDTPTTLQGSSSASSLINISYTQSTVTSTSSEYSTRPAASSEVDSTTRITSYLTHTRTSFVTVRPPPSKTNTDTDIQAVPTSRISSVSALPSGSGFPYPSGTAAYNGTVISPKPTYSELPINMGQVVGAGKSSLAAIVVALAFAHFA